MPKVHHITEGKVPRLPTAIEMEIVAMLARGDTYRTIQQNILSKYQRTIGIGVITNIKKRNPDSLATIQEAIVQREKDDAEGLLTRSRRLIGKKLRAAEQGTETIRVNELVAIAKESFHQSRVEQGLEGGAKQLEGGDTKARLKELQQLLEESDEVQIERMLFRRDKREQATAEPNVTYTVSGGGRNDPRVRLPQEDIPPPDHPDGPEVAPSPEEAQTS